MDLLKRPEALVKIGEEGIQMLDEETRQARASLRTANEAYRTAKSEINERFDVLAKLVEEAREASLDALDTSYGEQEQRITFEIECSKTQKRVAQAAVKELATALAGQKPPAAAVGIAAPDSGARGEEEEEKHIARARAALEAPVRHIRGIRVTAGDGAPFEQAASSIRALAALARAEPSDDGRISRHQRKVSTLSAGVTYRANGRKFLVLSSASEKRSLDVCGKIRGAIGKCIVDNLQANESLVSLDDLSEYDSVFVWVGGCTGFAGGPALGAVLAKYVASGGGVVAAPWALAIDEDGDGLRGDIVDQGLLGTSLGECISGSRLIWRRECQQEDSYSAAAGGGDDDYDPSTPRQCHPLMQGVRIVDGGAYSGHHSIQPIQDRAKFVEVAAMWDDGTPLALVSKSAEEGGRYTTAVINLYPISSDFSVRCWDTSCDFAVLMANALHITARPRPM